MIDEDMNIPLDQPTTNPKELFDIKDVEGKTELTSEQVMLFSRLKVMGARAKQKHGIGMIDSFIGHFLTLQLSKDRGSRKEYVSSFQSQNDERAGNLLDKFSMNLGK